jgi:hypothetical protein
MAAPAAWLLAHVERHDMLFPNSPVFLAALPAARDATALPREQPSLVIRAVRRAGLPVGSVFVAVPIDQGRVDVPGLRGRLGPRFVAQPYAHWLIIRATGPFLNRRAALTAAAEALSAAQMSIHGESAQLDGYFRQGLASLHGALRALESDQHAAATSTSS